MWSFFSRDPSKDFNFEIGELVKGLDEKSVWTLHKGKRKGSSEEVSVFVFDIRSGSETQLEVAKAAVKRLKTLRHPSILTYVDSYESDKILYLATEYVEPLATHLEKLTLEGAQKELYIAWGIFQITVSSQFS
jgi:SCY1-like protein 1